MVRGIAFWVVTATPTTTITTITSVFKVTLIPFPQHINSSAKRLLSARPQSTL